MAQQTPSSEEKDTDQDTVELEALRNMRQYAVLIFISPSTNDDENDRPDMARYRGWEIIWEMSTAK